MLTGLNAAYTAGTTAGLYGEESEIPSALINKRKEKKDKFIKTTIRKYLHIFTIGSINLSSWR